MLSKEDWQVEFPKLPYPRKRQWLFCEKYLENGFNASKAAKESGSKAKDGSSLRATASEILAHPSVKAFIDKRFKEMVMPADEVLTRLSVMAKGFDIADYVSTHEVFEVGKDGDQYLAGYALNVDFEKLQTDGFSHLVKKVKSTKAGIEVEWHDQMAALVHIGKTQGLFINHVDLTSKGEKVGIQYIDDWRSSAPQEED